LQLNLGLSYQGLQIYDKAVDAYGTANTLNPTDPLPNFYISRVYVGNGDYDRALQYAEQAVKAAPANANYHGNLGVMLYRKLKYPEAAQELAFVVNGGTLEDGTAIAALDLTSSSRIAEYYFIYGVTLAKMKPPRCDEALRIAQQILDKLRNDETWTFNANEIIRLCSEATPVAGGSETPAARVAGKTPTVTPTP